jgi:3-hydroxybutyryl-CoA dehydrogenase
MEIKTVGIVGCGLMGSGIAEVCARAGYNVVVREVDESTLNRGLQRIRQSLGRALERGRIDQATYDQTLGRIRGTVNMADLAESDFVIEAVVENLDLKKQVFAELDRICREGVILATNTSCLPVTDIAAVTRRPKLVIGTHFFNPAPVLPLVEIVRTILNDDETVETTRRFIESLGKTVVITKDRPGFIVNRLAIPFLLDAIRVLEEGLATKEEIDTAIKLGLNHPMGPFTLLDFVGLDTTLFVADAMYEQFRDPKYAAPPLLRRMVAAGLLGRKSGRGFYDYTSG